MGSGVQMERHGDRIFQENLMVSLVFSTLDTSLSSLNKIMIRILSFSVLPLICLRRKNFGSNFA